MRFLAALLALLLAAVPADAVILANGKVNVVGGAPALVGLGDSIMFKAAATSGCSTTVVRNISSYLTATNFYCKTAQWYYTNNSNTGTLLNLATPNNGIVVADAHTNASIASALGLGASVTTFFDQLAGTNQSNATIAIIEAGNNNGQNIESLLPGGVYCSPTNVSTNPCSDAALTTKFHSDYSKLITDIKTYAPSARIILMNVVNLAYINATSPEYPDDALAGPNTAADCGAHGKTSGSGNVCGLGDRWSRIINADINARYSATPNNSTTFTVIDVACLSSRYNPAWNNDAQGTPPGNNGIHPQDLGHAAIATLIQNTITTPVSPASGCSIGNFSGTVVGAPSGSFSPN